MSSAEIRVGLEFCPVEEIINADWQTNFESHRIDMFFTLADFFWIRCVLRVGNNVIEFVKQAPSNIKCSASFGISAELLKIPEVD